MVTPGLFEPDGCKRCGYYGVNKDPDMTVFKINASEKCPDFMPKHISGYWRDWDYLNSCFRSAQLR